jgi:hypothetical protein
MAHPVGRVLRVAVLFALTACETAHEPWARPGTSEAVLRRDLADCEREATGPGPFHFEAWTGADYETVRARIVGKKIECMEARGWRLIAQR